MPIVIAIIVLTVSFLFGTLIGINQSNSTWISGKVHCENDQAKVRDKVIKIKRCWKAIEVEVDEKEPHS